MHRKIVKAGKRTAVYAVSAALLFSGMSLDTFASEGAGLPSAGLDFFLSSNATSVKDLKEEEEVNLPETEVPKAESSGEGNSQSDSAETEKKEAPTVFTMPTAEPIPTPTPTADPQEEKVIEETAIATTTKPLNQVEREIEAKREEKGFRSLVIARVNDYVNVRSIPSEEGEILGKLYDKSVGEFISEQDGWYEIESGSVTGFVKAEYCVTGEDAVSLAREVGTRIGTVNTTTLKVREEPGMDAVVLGLVPIGDELIVTEEIGDWVKVDIEEGFGYVSIDYVELSTEFVKAESKAEEEARLAREEAERKAAQEAARKAAAKKSSSSSSGSSNHNVQAPVITSGSGSEMGSAVANFACQFVGNPYVYGGTSLTNGADCSGFVMSVYNNFGVSLPHSSAADRSVGSSVDGLANAQPGDIVCYSGHVGIYVGDGKIVHASTSKTGIIISNANYRSVLSVRRIF
ncbi:MAG: SH3 domain-containing protein [Lachnospiraceae bacterium]|jgi:cell wall-associated NlpC family hydrolase|nr:SH3 domain-containing protein [Lachnospiraceae bacterium]MCI9095405.1 SH3 domain-containing protein [Lachnospiraceae bacterium]MCI9204288.1 SH3 domain-containing protein [Lachnospiraceae bacterium]